MAKKKPTSVAVKHTRRGFLGGLIATVAGLGAIKAEWPGAMSEVGERVGGYGNSLLDSANEDNAIAALHAHNIESERINKFFGTGLSDENLLALGAQIQLLELYAQKRIELRNNHGSQFSRFWNRSMSGALHGGIELTGDIFHGLGRLIEWGYDRATGTTPAPEPPPPPPQMDSRPLSLQTAVALAILTANETNVSALFDSIAQKINKARGIYASADSLESGVMASALMLIKTHRADYQDLLKSMSNDDQREFALEQAQTLIADGLAAHHASLDDIRRVLGRTYLFDASKSLTVDDAGGIIIASEITGLSRALLLNITGPESGWIGREVSPTGATGFFQFTESTWMQMLNKYGNKVSAELGANAVKLYDQGDVPLARQVLDIKQQLDNAVGGYALERNKLALRSNSALNIIFGAYYAEQNANGLKHSFASNQRAMDIIDTPAFIRVANVSGEKGAKDLINAGLDADASAALSQAGDGRVVDPNKNFFAGTLRQVLDRVELALLTPEAADLMLNLALNGDLAKIDVKHGATKKAATKKKLGAHVLARPAKTAHPSAVHANLDHQPH